MNSKKVVSLVSQCGAQRNIGRKNKMTTLQASILLQQLGGNKFLAMTGTKNFLRGEVSETNPKAFLRMDLTRNKAGANRLRITLEANDTYTMEFYKMTLGKSTNWEAKITNEQIFENVYEDMLQSIFTQVTGLRTAL